MHTACLFSWGGLENEKQGVKNPENASSMRLQRRRQSCPAYTSQAVTMENSCISQSHPGQKEDPSAQ
jgi:hypothetical protein